MSTPFFVDRLDVLAFARAGQSLSGQWPLSQAQRLAEQLQLSPEACTASAGDVEWSLEGGQARVRGQSQTALKLKARALLPLRCERCLETVYWSIAIEREFVFAPNEQVAADWDEESEADVLVLSPCFNALELIEDELLLEIPLVPKHERCPVQLPHQAQTSDFALPEASSERPHPFAALAHLKRQR